MDLKILLQNAIRLEGPMRLDRFMSIVSDYYYNHHQPFGKNGDFITSPEISSSFSNAIGNWLLNIIKAKQPNEFQILELGPGNGTLLKHLLYYINQTQELDVLLNHVCLIEKSKSMMAMQKAILGNHKIKWLNTLSESEDIFTIVIANEFFDALPVRQFICQKEGWEETFVGYHPKEGFYFIKTKAALNRKADIGDIFEYSYQAELYASEISSVIKRSGGAGLIIDYGYTSPFKDATLQAIMSHKLVPLLEFVGDSDWSAHVNFSLLEEVFSSKGLYSNIDTQRDFLMKYGIEDMMIYRPKSLDRLIGTDSMGLLFKVMEVYSQYS